MALHPGTDPTAQETIADRMVARVERELRGAGR
jgi:hypothetical protein